LNFNLVIILFFFILSCGHKTRPKAPSKSIKYDIEKQYIKSFQKPGEKKDSKKKKK